MGEGGAIPAALARYLRNDRWLGKQYPVVAPRVSELARYSEGTIGECRAIVETYLAADNSTTFYGEMPIDRLRAAQQAFVDLRDDERILYLWDWSMWGTAASGLVITTHRVLW